MTAPALDLSPPPGPLDRACAAIAAGLPPEAFPGVAAPGLVRRVVAGLLEARAGRHPNRVRMEARWALWPVVGAFAWGRLLDEVTRLVFWAPTFVSADRVDLTAYVLADAVLRAAATAPLAWIWAVQEDVARGSANVKA